ncbi:MAG: DUF4259 domain-containing protein [Planctomycetota bacterium]|nr:DUF4259 domain-containing protein [Planctomycetota bacterium]
MGAWGAHAFDNDTACDWAGDFVESKDLKMVRQSIKKVLSTEDEYLDADAACEALAACEVIARLKGQWGLRNSYTASVDKWVESHPNPPPETLVRDALTAIQRITEPESELLDLWQEDDPKEWLDGIEDLRKRLGA